MSIWALTMCSILGIGVSRITSAQLRLSQRLEARLVSQYAAQAAVRHAWAMRQVDETPYETLQELRTAQEQELGRGMFRYTMMDEERRIPLNKAPQDVLARVPWLTMDAAVAITSSKLRPFHAIEELRLVEGVTEEMCEQAKDFLTVYGTGTVNINTAPPDVLRALGLDDNLVELIMRFRAGPDSQEGTADDGVFKDAGEIANTLRSYTGLFAAQEAELVRASTQGLLGVKSTALALHIETRVLGKPAMTYRVLLDATEEKIKRWSEG